jgi:hypothetical protein
MFCSSGENIYLIKYFRRGRCLKRSLVTTDDFPWALGHSPETFGRVQKVIWGHLGLELGFKVPAENNPSGEFKACFETLNLQ